MGVAEHGKPHFIGLILFEGYLKWVLNKVVGTDLFANLSIWPDWKTGFCERVVFFVYLLNSMCDQSF